MVHSRRDLFVVVPIKIGLPIQRDEAAAGRLDSGAEAGSC